MFTFIKLVLIILQIMHTSAVNKIQKIFFLVSVFMRYFLAISRRFLSYISFFCGIFLFVCSSPFHAEPTIHQRPLLSAKY